MDLIMVANDELKMQYLDKDCSNKANPCDGYDNGQCNVYNRPCDGCYQATREFLENNFGE